VGVLASYTLPAMAAWALIGLVLAALPLAGAALVAAACYGAYYGITELSGWRGLPPPGRRWQVPQTMMINASPRRRILVWGAILGPGFLTRNPYAGFGLLPLALAGVGGARAGVVAGLVLGAAIGAAHGSARALALLRDVRELRQAPVPSAGSPGPRTHLDLLLKIAYWRRLDGATLLAVAVIAAFAAARYLT
jgi:hypothetical protein